MMSGGTSRTKQIRRVDYGPGHLAVQVAGRPYCARHSRARHYGAGATDHGLRLLRLHYLHPLMGQALGRRTRLRIRVPGSSLQHWSPRTAEA